MLSQSLRNTTIKGVGWSFTDGILKVGTNLLGLSEEKIDTLIKCAEWMTEVQTRTYLANIIHE